MVCSLCNLSAGLSICRCVRRRGAARRDHAMSNWNRDGSMGFCGIPHKPGLYALFLGELCVYIGISKDLHNRVDGQHWKGTTFNDFVVGEECYRLWRFPFGATAFVPDSMRICAKWCIEPSKSRRIKRERKLIQRVRPLGNTKHARGRK